MLLHLGQMVASPFFPQCPEAQSGGSPWSHAWIAIDDSKNDLDPCILVSPKVLGLVPDPPSGSASKVSVSLR